MSLSEFDLAELKRAKHLLENPGLAAKIASALGAPIDKGLALLPARLPISRVTGFCSQLG